MKIDESSVQLSSQHSFESECKIEISNRCTFRTVFDNVAGLAGAPRVVAAELPERGEKEKVRQMLAQLIAEVIALIAGQSRENFAIVRQSAQREGVPEQPELKVAAARVSEFSWESVRTETIREHESSAFSASGVVRTADGKSIDFKLDLAMCRDYQSECREVDGGKVTLLDPLVINFDGQAATLGDTCFDFDLDSDGRSESLHGLTGGSAFLAFDRNGDGLINDGSELFGARSGDGFADLAQLDGDGNGWLDDADIDYASLKAWSRDAQGKDTLLGLKDQGIGAIYLGSTETPFALKDSANQLHGQVRASGFYLREDGRAGSLQQIDLAV